jgi:acyl-[acyl carrier protein]--UDP-N-acetylglucosamine O-acyltransferase
MGETEEGFMKELCLYEDESEQRQHISSIQRLVKDLGSSEEEIRNLYEDVLQEFKNEAKIKTFLSILVSKKVKQLLRARGR